MSANWNLTDPYVYQTLQNLKGHSIAVQTTRGSVRGVLGEVMPDHIVVQMGGAPFYVRISQIIWFHQLEHGKK